MNNPKEAIEKFLIRYDGNKSQCAKDLNVSRGTLHNWLKRPHSIPLKKAILMHNMTNGEVNVVEIMPCLKELIEVNPTIK